MTSQLLLAIREISMHRRFVVQCALLGLIASSHAVAESPVDSTSDLETIATEFGLADGPAWDGISALYFPDVKGEKLYRYIPAKKQLQPVPLTVPSAMPICGRCTLQALAACTASG
jgi:sugar lactone lactonase YvrE